MTILHSCIKVINITQEREEKDGVNNVNTRNMPNTVQLHKQTYIKSRYNKAEGKQNKWYYMNATTKLKI